MINVTNLNRRFIHFYMCLFIFFGLGIFAAYSQQMPKMNMDTLAMDQRDMQNQMMLPMAFFTHMGIPLNVGTYGLRVAALKTESEDKTNTEFRRRSHTEYNFQLETGLSKTVGLFIGGAGLFDDPTLEAMVQFLVWKSKNGMNGISPIVEFEFPLGKEATRNVYTLVGFSSTFSNSHLVIITYLKQTTS